MRKFVIALVGVATLAGPAGAGLICATPPEMKVLQSAALQQQLMVAALTCRLSADYNAFVTAYRGRLIQSDQALKAFFAARPRGEDYNAYKTRIANAVSLRSLHDAGFCASAQKVFDMALGRGAERNGLAPEPPQLIDTGYEGCRPVDDTRLIEARVVPRPLPRPQTRAAAPSVPAHVASLQLAKPVPAPRPVVTAEAERALAIAKPSAKLAAARTAAKPVTVAAPIATTKPVQIATAGSTVRTTSSAGSKPATPSAATPVRIASAPLRRDDVPAEQFEDEYSSLDAQPSFSEPPRMAAVERPRWRPVPRTGEEADDRIPNAYRPGAQWVRDAGPAWSPPRWSPAAYGTPRRRSHARMVLGPDGRWIVLIGTGPRWGRD